MRHLTSKYAGLASFEAWDPRIRHRRHGYDGGFTLVELLVTIAVAAILTVIGVPALRSFLQNDRQWTNATSLVMALNAARSEAIKQDAPVSVCTTTNGTTCSANPWAQGWIVLSSVAGSTPVLTVPALPTGTSLTETSVIPAKVTFLSTGMASALAQFTLCDDRGASYARYVQVSLTGSIASSPTVGKDLNGNALACP